MAERTRTSHPLRSNDASRARCESSATGASGGFASCATRFGGSASSPQRRTRSGRSREKTRGNCAFGRSTSSLYRTELGRAICHLAQHRGFQSNRKTDRATNEKGAITVATKRLEETMAADGARTMAEWCMRRMAKGLSVRSRPLAGTKVEYDFYPLRRLVKQEFDRLWDAQARHDPAAFSAEARTAIEHALFFQRLLKEVKPGPCTFVPSEPRLRKATLLFQQVRLLSGSESSARRRRRSEGQTAHHRRARRRAPSAHATALDDVCLATKTAKDRAGIAR